MDAYAIRTRMPKNTRGYLDYFKGEVLKRCLDRRADCIVEFLDGRIVLFTDCKSPENLLRGIRGFISMHRILIFHRVDDVVNEILGSLGSCESFAIRSNKKAIEEELGARIQERKNVKVDLISPCRLFYVEKRGKFYLLFLNYP